MTFPENLLRLRRTRGLKQQEVADALGLSLRVYQYYEHGQRDPTLPTLIGLADLYDISLDELVCRQRK